MKWLSFLQPTLEDFKPLVGFASGELSHLMLAIKSAFSRKARLTSLSLMKWMQEFQVVLLQILLRKFIKLVSMVRFWLSPICTVVRLPVINSLLRRLVMTIQRFRLLFLTVEERSGREDCQRCWQVMMWWSSLTQARRIVESREIRWRIIVWNWRCSRKSWDHGRPSWNFRMGLDPVALSRWFDWQRVRIVTPCSWENSQDLVDNQGLSFVWKPSICFDLARWPRREVMTIIVAMVEIQPLTLS